MIPLSILNELSLIVWYAHAGKGCFEHLSICVPAEWTLSKSVIVSEKYYTLNDEENVQSVSPSYVSVSELIQARLIIQYGNYWGETHNKYFHSAENKH